MAVAGGPNIVEDGLVLALDAANVKSYTSGSTTWRDKSGNGYDGTLTNGPTFSSDNGGALIFDGADDYASCGTVSFSENPFTIEIVFKWDDYGTNSVQFPIAGVNEQLEIHTGGPDAGINGLRFIPYDFLGANTNASMDIQNTITDGINYITFTAEYSAPSKYYKNGVLEQTSTTTASTPLNTSQTVYIGRRAPSNGYYFDGNIYTVRIYNRALTAQEVEQNYNATKGRFGL